MSKEKQNLLLSLISHRGEDATTTKNLIGYFRASEFKAALAINSFLALIIVILVVAFQ
jgi:hypothetical protein